MKIRNNPVIKRGLSASGPLAGHGGQEDSISQPFFSTVRNPPRGALRGGPIRLIYLLCNKVVKNLRTELR